MKKVRTLGKRLYAYPQEMWLPKRDVALYGQNTKRRYVIADRVLDMGNEYEMAREQGVDIHKFFENNWLPVLPDIGDAVTEEVNIARGGYHGLFQLLPFLNKYHVLEFTFSVEYDADDCEDFDGSEDGAAVVEPIEDPDFSARQCFWAVNRYDDILLGHGDDKPNWEIDNGYVKWDVGDREAGAMLDKENSFVFGLFPYSKTDEHGVEMPYRVTVRVEGKYRRHRYNYATKKHEIV